MRSQLANLPVQREPDPLEGRRLARESWHAHGLIMLRVEWLQTKLDRELLLALAETAHGKRSRG